MYLGIDLGTSAVKVILTDEAGHILQTVSKEYPLWMPQYNWAEQSPELWWEKTEDAIEELLQKTGVTVIDGISFSGQMHGLVVLDKKDAVIRPAMIWCDQRTEEVCQWLQEKVGMEKLIQWVGNRALTGFTAPKLLWMKEHEPEQFASIEKIMLPKDYIQYRMTGVFATDVSDASGTLFLDVEKKQWSGEMLEVLGITEKQLPKLYESYEVVGELQEQWQKKWRLEKPVKVIAGAGDQAAGAIGVGVVKTGVLSVALGTSGVVFLACDEYAADKEGRLHSFAHANGKYHQMGVILSASGALKWWVEQVNQTKAYTAYLEEGASQAKAEGLYFLPYLIGERTPINDAHAKGCFIGLRLTHTKEDMTRAVLEGISFALRDSFEILKELQQPMTEIRVSGGGSQSPFWKQLLADIFQLPVTELKTAQGPAYGAAILAKAGVEQKSVEEICEKWIVPSQRYLPEESKKAWYDKKYSVYHGLYSALKDTFLKLDM